MWQKYLFFVRAVVTVLGNIKIIFKEVKVRVKAKVRSP
jgi:hypothetical protein